MANPFSKDQRVEVTSGGKLHHGVVYKIEGENLVVRLDNGNLCKPFPHRHFKPSKEPLPANGVHRAWAKGERVEFKADVKVGDGPRARKETQVVHGTVIGAGKTLKVMADGGQSEYTVPPALLSPSTKVLTAAVPDPMDAWAVTSYKEIRSMSEETVAFTAKVTHDGKVVMLASNDGHGGCNRYGALPGFPRIRETFAKAAKDWFVRHGVPEVIEADDMFITWHATQRPYAVTGPEFVREHGLMMEDVGNRILMREKNDAWREAQEAEEPSRGPGM